MIFDNSYWINASQKPRPSRLGTGVIVFLLLCATLLVLLSPEPGLGVGETYRVGIYQNPPKVFVDTDGKARGIYVDILDHIAQAEGWNIKYVPYTWDQCLEALNRGDIDLLVNVASLHERRQLFSYNKYPILINWGQVLMHKGINKQDPHELHGKVIAVLKGGVHGKNFGKLLKGMNIDYKLYEVKSYEEALRSVSEHKADAAVVSNLFGFSNADKYGLDVTQIILPKEELHIIARKDGPNPLATIDKYLAAWIPDKKSIYHESLNRWLHLEDRSEIPKWVYWAMGLIASLFVILSMAITISRRTIRSRTRELSESESRYRNLFDKSGDAMFIHDLAGRFLEVNREACDRLGYSKDEMLRMSVFDIDAPAFAATVLERIKSLRVKGELVFEAAHVTKQGETIPVEIISTPITFENKSAIFSAARDMRERYETQEKLKRSEEIYRKHFENASDVIFMMDNTSKILKISSSTLDKLGYRAEDLEGKLLYQLPIFAAKDMDVAQKRLQRVLKGEELTAKIYRMTTKDGQIKYAEISSSPVYEGKHVVGLISLARDITDRKEAEDRLEQTMTNLERALGGTIDLLTATLERRDPYTAGHQERVADLSCAIAEEMGIDQGVIDGLRLGGQIHDLGKIAIPSDILSKPGKLSDAEFALIKEHPNIGYEILSKIEFPWPLAKMIHQHHERMDGSGYPHSLAGEEIIMEARILAVADVVEAMASHRPYRPASGIEKALEEIGTHKGTAYDPNVVEACLRLFREKGYGFD